MCVLTSMFYLAKTNPQGCQRIFGLEHHYISGLFADAPPGIKIKVKDVMIRRGMLLLTPETVQIVGGSVATLVEAKNSTRMKKRKRR